MYAFCRWADDLGDEVESSEESLSLLAWWRSGLEDCLNGSARHPVYVALGETIRQRNVPPELFHDLISAFERDQRQTRYETYSDLQSYCVQSANPVGRILLHLADAANDETLRLSDNVCTGLQLINFWQDVHRDLQIGRVYLPQEDLNRYDVRENDLATGRSTPAFQRLLAFQVDRAEQLLLSGGPLAQQVPRNIRFDIRLFALGGLHLCDKIRQIDYRVLEQRPKLSKADLLSLAWKATTGTGFRK